MTLDDVIGKRVDDRVRITCPFPGHDDSNPSAVYYADGHVYCFACRGHAKSLTDLVRQREFPDLPEGQGMYYASMYIARHMRDAQIPAKGEAPKPQPDPGPDQLTLLAMTLFCDAARANLEHREDEHDRIVRERGIRCPSAMGIGLADASLVRMVRRHLARLGYGDDAVAKALVDAGVHGMDRNGGVVYRLANRIIIPEYRADPRRAVYYQARANSPAARQKYLNPPIRNKPMFGWDSLRRDTERVWIGEGPFDMLPFLEAGESAIAGMGAHIGERQVALIAREAGEREVIVAFDNDEAGREASSRIVENLRLLDVRAHAAFPREGFKDFGEWASREDVAGIIPEVLWHLPD